MSGILVFEFDEKGRPLGAIVETVKNVGDRIAKGLYAYLVEDLVAR